MGDLDLDATDAHD
jgi:hypothetical protein